MGLIDYLLVGGGKPGGNGSDEYSSGNGGNGGEVRQALNYILESGSYSVTIGGSNQNSSFNGIIARTGYGAAGGSGTINGAGNPGANGIVASINNGRYGAGGGAGAATYNGKLGGTGGVTGGGRGEDVTFTDHTAGAGNNTAGTANRGGGGGGGAGAWFVGAGKPGGSGVALFRYLTGTAIATGGTITTVGEYTLHTFTSSGTFVYTEVNPVGVAFLSEFAIL